VTRPITLVITVDCFSIGEQMTASTRCSLRRFHCPPLPPWSAPPYGSSGSNLAEDGQELTARCQRGDVVQDLRLSDLVFPADAPAAWIHAAYRRCLGLRAHRIAMPAGWKPSWL